MTKEQIVNFVKLFVLPIFPGIKIETNDHFRELERVFVGQPAKREDDPGPNPGPVYLVIQAEYRSTAENRVLLFRSQLFDAAERDFIRKVFEITKKYYDTLGSFEQYEEIIFNEAVADVISTNNNTVLSIFSYLEILSNRTYEGKNIAFSIAIDETRQGIDGLDIKEFIRNDYFMVLTNSINTVITIDILGKIIDYSVQSGTPNTGIYPVVFKDIANYSEADRIVITLIINGDILIFKNKNLVFAKRRGHWIVFSHEQIITQMGCGVSGRWSGLIRKAIYETAIDVSFMHTGGLICLAKADNNERYLEKTYEKYLFTSPAEQQCSKAKLFSALLGKRFQELDRNLRKEICSVDGAILVKSTGEIVAVGAIIKNPAESDEGARTAAAMSLSELGLAVKISTDGMIKGFFETPDSNEPRYSIG